MSQLTAPHNSILSAVIYPDYARVAIPSNPLSKDVSLPDFLGLLNSAVSRQVDADDLPVMDLPLGALRISKDASNLKVLTYHPEQFHTVKHVYQSQETVFTVPFPNIVMVFELSMQGGHWTISRTAFSATELSPLQVASLPEKFPTYRNSDKLFFLPLPNIYSSGEVCYGNNSMPYKYTAETLSGLNYYYEFLHTAPFNNDLSVVVQDAPNQAKSYLTWLAKQSKFPYQILSRR